jgi:hypothetical protein
MPCAPDGDFSGFCLVSGNVTVSGQARLGLKLFDELPNPAKTCSFRQRMRFGGLVPFDRAYCFMSNGRFGKATEKLQYQNSMLV